MMGIAFNIAYGSWDTGARWSEAKGAVEEWMKDPSVDGLLEAHMPDILLDKGLHDREYEADALALAAEQIRSAPCWWRRGSGLSEICRSGCAFRPQILLGGWA